MVNQHPVRGKVALAQAFVFSFQWMVPVLSVFHVSLAEQPDDFAEFTHIVTAFFCAFDVFFKLCCKDNFAHGYSPRYLSAASAFSKVFRLRPFKPSSIA